MHPQEITPLLSCSKMEARFHEYGTLGSDPMPIHFAALDHFSIRWAIGLCRCKNIALSPVQGNR